MNCAVFSGCINRCKYPQNINAAMFLLRRMGFSLKLARNEICCGMPAYLSGDKKSADRFIYQLYDMLSSHGLPDLLVTLCPCCRKMFREFERFVTVKAIMEILVENAELISKMGMDIGQMSVVIHLDPSLDVAGIDDSRIHKLFENSDVNILKVIHGISGATGNLPILYPPVSEIFLQDILKYAKNADLLLTTDPHTQYYLNEYIMDRKIDIRIHDLTFFLASCMDRFRRSYMRIQREEHER